ncbi:DUF4290 domain-containing protein [Siphonobacter aquaeclarae]|uniref:DUF4290 domain-containing protein n=1 Tax=Siphonobacter aquaeclarae TaxID=563176 RepID=UPI0021CF8843|nr:DUF4290 domain-containing protein [Siphonobacter aquaeclarae]
MSFPRSPKTKNIRLKEYGSNIQKLVDYLVTIEDREKRTKQAYVLIELMRQIHPNMKEGQDYTNKLWDDLYIMSGFRLDVDSPFPPPSPEAIGKKPNGVPYATHQLQFRHYGRNLELMVQKAISLTNEYERWAFASYIAKMMKSFYTAWNKDNADDSTVWEHLKIISKGGLNAEIERIRKEGYLDIAPRDRYSSTPGVGGGGNYQPQPSHHNRPHHRNNNNQGGGGNFQRRSGGGGNNNNNNRNNHFNNRNRKK